MSQLQVLVTGATGFVGARLAAALVEEGHDVRAMTRRPEAYDGPGTPVAGDVAKPDSLGPALAGVDVAYYLIHSLGSARFEAEDAAAARAFGEAAAHAGVRQIVYLGGLGGEDQALSPHLRSRREVEGLLGAGRRAGDGAACRDRGRPRRHLVGDDPPARSSTCRCWPRRRGRTPDPADRAGRRGAVPGRRARPPAGAGPGVRGRRRRRAQLRGHAAPRGRGAERPGRAGVHRPAAARAARSPGWSRARRRTSWRC